MLRNIWVSCRGTLNLSLRTLTWLDYGCTCPSCVLHLRPFSQQIFTVLAGNAQLHSGNLMTADFFLRRVLWRLAL